jgi:NADH:ubiquinone oxidoreductase subunit 6 (subunit J)
VITGLLMSLGARLAGVRLKLILAGAVALAIVVALARAFYAGKRSERDAQAVRNAAAVRQAKEIADEVHSMARADVDRRLSRWMRDGSG